MRPLQILLAEDNNLDAYLVEQALEKALAQHQIPYSLKVLRNGSVALKYLREMGQTSDKPCPDLLLLDLNLPLADGPEVLGIFRKHPACSNTPVIIVTSSEAPEDIERVTALGISRYFRKPTDLDAFMELGPIVRDVITASAPG